MRWLRGQQDHPFIGADHIEHMPDPLVEQIPIQSGAGQADDFFFQGIMLDLQLGQMGFGGGDLAVEMPQGNQTTIPLDRVIAEIADREDADHGSNKATRFGPLHGKSNNHALMESRRSRRVNTDL